MSEHRLPASTSRPRSIKSCAAIERICEGVYGKSSTDRRHASESNPGQGDVTGATLASLGPLVADRLRQILVDSIVAANASAPSNIVNGAKGSLCVLRPAQRQKEGKEGCGERLAHLRGRQLLAAELVPLSAFVEVAELQTLKICRSRCLSNLRGDSSHLKFRGKTSSCRASRQAGWSSAKWDAAGPFL